MDGSVSMLPLKKQAGPLAPSGGPAAHLLFISNSHAVHLFTC